MILRILFVLLLTSPLVSLGQENDIKLGTVWFKDKNASLTKAAKATLDSIIIQIKANPTMNAQAVSFNKDFCDKCGVRNMKRCAAVLTYLSRHGISVDRLMSTNRLEGELNKVDLFLTSSSLSNTSPPVIRKRNKQ